MFPKIKCFPEINVFPKFWEKGSCAQSCSITNFKISNYNYNTF